MRVSLCAESQRNGLRIMHLGLRMASGEGLKARIPNPRVKGFQVSGAPHGLLLCAQKLGWGIGKHRVLCTGAGPVHLLGTLQVPPWGQS